VSGTVVSLLTPPGAGAIATVEVRGPRAWELAKQLFTPVGKPALVSPEVNRFWFGTLGNDEVVLAVTERGASAPRGPGAQGADAPRSESFAIEVHCHGGRRVVRWVIEQFLSHGCVEERTPRPSGEGFELLQRAPTLRTASILLDQLNGAFANEVRAILALLETDPPAACDPLRRIAELGNTVGRHLIEPWKVVVAGPPNVGKSSLVNALAGYQRSVVSEVAGTTRDAVSVRTAFDGWPVELIDTAGLRDAEGLEAEGIEQARRELDEADLVLWVMDATSSKWDWPPDDRLHAVLNKSDALTGERARTLPLVSAKTGEGIPALVAELVARLVPSVPAPCGAVPYTPLLIESVDSAFQHATIASWGEAKRHLCDALAVAEAHHVG
jgi:tRNA modification GTPase